MYRRTTMKRSQTVSLLLVPVLLCLMAGTSRALDGNEVLRKVDERMQPASYEMYRKLINVEPDGTRKEFVLYTIKKGQDKMAFPDDQVKIGSLLAFV